MVTQRRRNAGPVLSQQVKGMVGEGNRAYVDGRVQEAIRVMQEVIRIESRAISAWAVLANCQTDMGLHDMALRLRIMAAHLTHGPEPHGRSVIVDISAFADQNVSIRDATYVFSTCFWWRWMLTSSSVDVVFAIVDIAETPANLDLLPRLLAHVVPPFSPFRVDVFLRCTRLFIQVQPARDVSSRISPRAGALSLPGISARVGFTPFARTLGSWRTT